MKLRSNLLALAVSILGVSSFVITDGALAKDNSDQVSVLKKKKKKSGRGQAKKKIAEIGLAAIPDAGDLLKAKKKSSAQSIHDVSGTAPTLMSIPELGIKNVFWKPGVIDGLLSGDPTQQQCGEFFAGDQDGASGGLGACHMSESVGHSFQLIMEAGNSLCYMKRIPTQANVDAGGIALNSGELPGGDVTKIFASPEGSDSRLVKIAVSGFDEGEEGPSEENVFIKVYGTQQNSESSALYKVDLWFCTPGDETPNGAEQISISNAGRFSAVSLHDDSARGGGGGLFQATSEGFLTIGSDGEVTFDPTKPRSATAEMDGAEWGFKSAVQISSDNKIKTKFYDVFGGGSNKGFAVTRFSGSGVDSLRFLEGAFKGLNSGDEGFSGATEFRDSFYAAAPDSGLKGQLNSVDLAEDEFYQNPPTSSFDLSEYSCAAEADIEVSLDMSNTSVMESIAPCEQRLDGMHFCHEDEEVNMAQQMFFEACMGPGGPPGPGEEGPGPGEEGPGPGGP